MINFFGLFLQVKSNKYLVNLNNKNINFYCLFQGYKFFINFYISNFFYYNQFKLLYLNVQKKFIILNNVYVYKQLQFYKNFFSFKLFKMHGINMLNKIFLINNEKYFFLRIGYSHGFFFKLENLINIRIFKNRYFFVSSFNFDFLNNFSYIIRIFRKFFKYKLIGVKFGRDFFKIKVGKKKTF